MAGSYEGLEQNVDYPVLKIDYEAERTAGSAVGSVEYPIPLGFGLLIEVANRPDAAEDIRAMILEGDRPAPTAAQLAARGVLLDKGDVLTAFFVGKASAPVKATVYVARAGSVDQLYGIVLSRLAVPPEMLR